MIISCEIWGTNACFIRVQALGAKCYLEIVMALALLLAVKLCLKKLMCLPISWSVSMSQGAWPLAISLSIFEESKVSSWRLDYVVLSMQITIVYLCNRGNAARVKNSFAQPPNDRRSL